MATFNISSPDHGASMKMEPRVRETEMGDGYTQSVQDGINDMREAWNLAFTRRPKSIIDSIDDFLRENRNSAFFWLNPDGMTKKYRCKSWSKVVRHAQDADLSCEFIEDFEP
jgi:phage-related protein